MRNIALTTILLILSALMLIPSGYSEPRKEIKLVAAQTDGGLPLMKALALRKTSRSFSGKMLPDQVLSNLLWAACGINRAGEGKKTAPTALNNQEIDIYVALVEGLYLYNAKAHALTLIVAKDLRAMTGKQGFAGDAPLNLIYVADLSKIKSMSDEDKALYSGADTGFISQNVYLFCASEGLATVVRGYVDKEALAAAMNLGKDKKIMLAQTVGYPK